MKKAATAHFNGFSGNVRYTEKYKGNQGKFAAFLL
jgi:hypothetical protein